MRNIFWNRMRKMRSEGERPDDLDNMARLLVRERDRADRNCHEFSLVLFQVDTSPRNRQGELILREILESRVRTIDEVGWFDGQLCALLPYTGSDGAWIVARDVARGAETRAVSISCFVHTYPEPWFQDDVEPHDRQADGKFAATPSAASVSVSAPADNFANSQSIQVDPTVRPTPFWKRVIDVAGALVGLTLFSPLLIAIALFIRRVSPGPVLFRQQRIGLGGQMFTILKFRTMYPNVNTRRHHEYVGTLIDSNEPLAKLDHGGQLIPGGSLLRKLGLDELPQLWNVLRGDMSLVGPRPDVLSRDNYQRWNLRRFDVVPGITGLWQVNGKNRTTFHQMIRYDLTYARHRSLVLDLWILFRTIPAVLGQLVSSKETC